MLLGSQLHKYHKQYDMLKAVRPHTLPTPLATALTTPIHCLASLNVSYLSCTA